MEKVLAYGEMQADAGLHWRRVTRILILAVSLFIALALRPAHADCIAEANRVLPGGDWGMISREGVKKYLCQGNPALVALERQRDANRHSYEQRLGSERKALAMANRVSLLIGTQRITLREWVNVFGACGNGRAELLKCVEAQESGIVSVTQLAESSRLLLADLDALIDSDGPETSAYYRKALDPIRVILQAHLTRLQKVQHRIQLARSGS